MMLTWKKLIHLARWNGHDQSSASPAVDIGLSSTSSVVYTGTAMTLAVADTVLFAATPASHDLVSHGVLQYNLDLKRN